MAIIPTWATGFVDFDNDGYGNIHLQMPLTISSAINCFATAEMAASPVFPIGRLSPQTQGEALLSATTITMAMSVNNNHPATLLRNDMGNSQWLMLRTIGTRSNRDGIGARVELVAGITRIVEEVRSGAGYLSGRDTRLHFGLGSHSYADRLTIRWPSGILQEMKNVPSNQVLVITEPAN